MAAALPGPATVPVLERLMQLDSVVVHQTSHGCDGNNYTVLISEDEPLFTMNEEVPNISRFFRGGAERPFIFDGVDNTGNKFFRFIHPKARCWNVSRRVELFMNDQLTYVIRAEKTWLTPIFTIKDPQLQPVVRLKGKIRESVLKLETNDKVVIGSIEKKWLGWKKELLSCKNDFTIKFPADLAVQCKLAVIVACVFIDFAFFEGK